ncbi:MAG: hypothetical protein M1825_004081 [Sarcosagium campestre]|nr:MAG: hypothetical protein M1825_004081 [Sarcosagium campestre]
MEPPSKPNSANLFEVYLRLRPQSPPQPLSGPSLYPILPPPERFLTVEDPDPESSDGMPTHITINPPTDSRRRAVEKFGFTRVFQERASQLDVFEGAGVIPLVEGVLAANGRAGRDALVATLGVTGSGKTHTILGSRSQRGISQLALDLLFRSAQDGMSDPSSPALLDSLALADSSEAHLMTASELLDSVHGEARSEKGLSRAPTPVVDNAFCATPSRRQQNINFPTLPDISNIKLPVDQYDEYAILISMYEVYNDRIFDLLTAQASSAASKGMYIKDLRRRPLLFKSTEQSPERKVVAGLRKILCSNLGDALAVLEAGLTERRVAGTGSNSVSSRSHGFFCIEVKKRPHNSAGVWASNAMTIVDLAGSERARAANTAGATLAEAGKINESLMYLGQCLQLQSDSREGNKVNKAAIVPYRQCKLTELLFSNSFSSTSSSQRYPQKAIMIVTADPVGDFNATSQILRYSALAREVTVPRIPSVSSTILSGVLGKPASGRSTPTTVSLEELEAATQEVAKLQEELDKANIRFTEQETLRIETEITCKAAEDKCRWIEQQVRDELWIDMERRLLEERSRWEAARGQERMQEDETLDAKLKLLTCTVKIHEDPPALSDERIRELEDENDMLRRKLQNAERELQSTSPTKKKGGKKASAAAAPAALAPRRTTRATRSSALQDLSIVSGIEQLAVEDTDKIEEEEQVAQLPKTPGTRKLRKLTTRKWDLADEEPVLNSPY